jgi:hypothetical protein
VVLIVPGFIALLNVAVITATLGQTRVEPFGGVTEVTVGGVRGLPALPGFLSGSPHPATKAASRNAEIQILLTMNLRISFSSSRSYKAFHASTREAVEVRERMGIYGFDYLQSVSFETLPT